LHVCLCASFSQVITQSNQNNGQEWCQNFGLNSFLAKKHTHTHTHTHTHFARLCKWAEIGMHLHTWLDCHTGHNMTLFSCLRSSYRSCFGPMADERTLKCYVSVFSPSCNWLTKIKKLVRRISLTRWDLRFSKSSYSLVSIHGKTPIKLAAFCYIWRFHPLFDIRFHPLSPFSQRDGLVKKISRRRSPGLWRYLPLYS